MAETNDQPVEGFTLCYQSVFRAFLAQKKKMFLKSNGNGRHNIHKFLQRLLCLAKTMISHSKHITNF